MRIILDLRVQLFSSERRPRPFSSWQQITPKASFGNPSLLFLYAEFCVTKAVETQMCNYTCQLDKACVGVSAG